MGCTQYKVGYEVHKVGYEVGVASNTRSEIWWEYELQYGGYEKKVRIQSNTSFSFENEVVHLVTRNFFCSVPAKKNHENICSWAQTPYWPRLHHQVRFWIPRCFFLSCSIKKKSMFSALAAAPSRDRHHSSTVWCAHVSAAPCISPGRPAPAPQPQRLPPLFADSAAAPPPPHCSSN